MKILYTLFLLSTLIFSQNSVHKEHTAQSGILENHPSLFPQNGEGIIPLQPKRGTLTHAVFGYLPDWEYLDTRNYLRYDLLTHIAAFDFTVSTTGAITYPSYWPWTDVINAAHQNGVKVILTAVNFNGNEINTIMTNPTSKWNFFTNLASAVTQFQLDGVNVDFEDLNVSDRGAVVNGFMQDLSNYLKSINPQLEVSFASPAINWGSHWNLQGLANACDYLFIMEYGFYGSWSTNSGPTAPLTGGSYNISVSINSHYANANKQKLILGIPYYGLKWKTETNMPQSNVTSYVGSTRWPENYTGSQTNGMLWSVSHQTPWFRYQLSNQWYQVWYDDANSLGLKYDFAKDKNFKGVGMWALGYDDNRTELWQVIENKFLSQIPVELEYFSAEVSESKVNLKWKTATETNNSGFAIERLKDSKIDQLKNWEEIAFIKGNGTTTEPNEYFFSDKINQVELTTQKFKYRLKQIDHDGSFEYSKEIEVKLISEYKFSLEQNYPNPFNPATKIKYSIPASQTFLQMERGRGEAVTLKIYDILGKEKAELVNEQQFPGEYVIEWDASDFPSGIYFYTLTSGSYKETKKLLLMK